MALVAIVASLAFGLNVRAEEASTASPGAGMIRLLESGRVPKERVGAIVEALIKRGNGDDLSFVFKKTVEGDAFPPDVRTQALHELAQAASERGVKPTGDLSGLVHLLDADKKSAPPVQFAAIELAGLWKVEAAAKPLAGLAAAPNTDSAVRSSAISSLVSIGGPQAKQTLEQLLAADRPLEVRYRAVAGLAHLDTAAAAKKAIEVLSHATERDDPSIVLDAFLDRKGGPDQLVSALEVQKLSPDVAKLALRHLYSVGRTDANLIGALSKAAGIEANAPPPSKEEVQKLVAEVMAQGDPARGENVFRRSDLSCMKCHSVSGAGGQVGPELSPVGGTSPVEYVVTSVLQPDLAVKEQYQLATVETADGRIVQGIIVEENSDRLVLKEATGAKITIPASPDNTIVKGGSLMPKGLSNLMTHGEFLDLVRFVSSLGKPGPYALRTTPTVQRWRVLTPVPPQLASAVPDEPLFNQFIVRAAETSWQPAYAKVRGDLPLADLTKIAHAPVLYLRAEIDVTAEGPVTLKLDNPEGITAWIDESPLAVGKPTSPLTAGPHLLTLRVDTAARHQPTLRTEFARPDGSPVQFTVLGGT